MATKDKCPLLLFAILVYNFFMKFFVTGRSTNYSLVEHTFDVIEKRGHQVTLRWTDLPMVKP